MIPSRPMVRLVPGILMELSSSQASFSRPCSFRWFSACWDSLLILDIIVLVSWSNHIELDGTTAF